MLSKLGHSRINVKNKCTILNTHIRVLNLLVLSKIFREYFFKFKYKFLYSSFYKVWYFFSKKKKIVNIEKNNDMNKTLLLSYENVQL